MEVLECLLELGASVDVCDGDGATLLHKASIEGSGASVEMLIRFRHEVNCFVSSAAYWFMSKLFSILVMDMLSKTSCIVKLKYIYPLPQYPSKCC